MPRGEAISDGVNQYPPGRGMPDAARRDRRAPAALLRHPPRPRTARCWSPPARPRRSRRRSSRCSSRATRSSRSSRSTTPTARLIALAGGVHRTVPLRAPDFQPDLDELRARRDRPHPRHPRQQPAQPDRRRASPRETLELIVELAAPARRAHRHRRGLRAPHLRRRRTCPIATLPGARERTVDASPRAARPSTRRGGRSAGSSAPAGHRHGDPGRQAVPHLRQRRAVPAGDRASASACPTPSSPASPPPAPPSATCSRPGCARRASTVSRAAGLAISSWRMPHRSGATDAAELLPRTAGAAPAWSADPDSRPSARRSGGREYALARALRRTARGSSCSSARRPSSPASASAEPPAHRAARRQRGTTPKRRSASAGLSVRTRCHALRADPGARATSVASPIVASSTPIGSTITKLLPTPRGGAWSAAAT